MTKRLTTPDQARATTTISTGEDMRAARLELGLTQADMALLMGMTQQHYCALETGSGARKPTGIHLASVAMIVRLYELGALPLYLATKKNEVVKK